MAATLRARYTTDDVSDTTPTWIDATSKVRAFNTSRGRDSELGRVEAGTATVLLDNRTRTFDPTFNALIRPGNRWWLEDTITGESVFFGYAKRYVQGWPAAGRGDAFCEVQLVDEMQRLALARLPVMDPPDSSTYADVVLHDEPQGYWRMQSSGNIDFRVTEPAAGNATLVGGSGTYSRFSGAIVGDPDADVVGGVYYGARSSTQYLRTTDMSTLVAGLDVQGPGDAAGLSAFTFETWYNSSEAAPAAQRAIISGPLSSAAFQYNLTHETSGTIRAVARNSGGTTYFYDSAAAISANTWYHLAIVVDGSNTLLYINGVQQPTPASFTGSVGVMDAGGYLQFGTTTAVGGTRAWDEAAFYRYAVPAARLLAHYTAGVSRGFTTQDPGNRFNSVISAGGITSGTGGVVQTGTREMIPTFMHGQSVLEELRKCEDAENVDALMFIGKDGTINFLADGHRSGAPWSTVQATFDDDGTDLEYTDISVDYSDSWIFNKVDISRDGGTLDSSTDATSVSAYGELPLQVATLPITTDSDVATIGDSLLAKYKDPQFRITSLTVNTNRQAVATGALGLEIGDRIRVFRTQLIATSTYPSTGLFPDTTLYPESDRIDQTLFVQKIEVSATPGVPWTIRLGVSPL